MIRANVQGCEVVFIILNFWTDRNRKTCSCKKIRNLLQNNRHRMQGAFAKANARQSYINAFFLQSMGDGLLTQAGFGFGQCCLNSGFGPIQERPLPFFVVASKRFLNEQTLSSIDLAYPNKAL